MSNDDDGKKPMPKPNDKGKGHMFNAFQNLSLFNINNKYEPGESSRNSNSSNNIFNVQYNFARLYEDAHPISLSTAPGLRAPPSLSAAPGLRAPPSLSAAPGLDAHPISLSTAPGLRAPPSLSAAPGLRASINSGPPSASPVRSDIDLRLDRLLYRLLQAMKVPTNPAFIRILETIDTYPEAERESLFFRFGSMLTSNNSTFLDVATNQDGSYALRTLLKRSPRLDGLIFDAVCKNFWPLMNSKNGRLLVVPTIRAVDKQRKEILYKLTYDCTLLLAMKETGCVALNDVFQEMRGPFRVLTFRLVAQKADWLSFDPYGTHVVQNILTLQNPLATQLIAATLFGSFFRLARAREGSYVVEKCLNSEYGRDKVLEEFRGNDKEWVRMANDKFGNFVAQNALRTMKRSGMKQMLRGFVEKLRPHFSHMKLGHGKNTVRVIQEEIDEWLHQSPEHLLPDDLLDLLYK